MALVTSRRIVFSRVTTSVAKQSAGWVSREGTQGGYNRGAWCTDLQSVSCGIDGRADSKGQTGAQGGGWKDEPLPLKFTNTEVETRPRGPKSLCIWGRSGCRSRSEPGVTSPEQTVAFRTSSSQRPLSLLPPYSAVPQRPRQRPRDATSVSARWRPGRRSERGHFRAEQ